MEQFNAISMSIQIQIQKTKYIQIHPYTKNKFMTKLILEYPTILLVETISDHNKQEFFQSKDFRLKVKSIKSFSLDSFRLNQKSLEKPTFENPQFFIILLQVVKQSTVYCSELHWYDLPHNIPLYIEPSLWQQAM